MASLAQLAALVSSTSSTISSNITSVIQNATSTYSAAASAVSAITSMASALASSSSSNSVASIQRDISSGSYHLVEPVNNAITTIAPPTLSVDDQLKALGTNPDFWDVLQITGGDLTKTKDYFNQLVINAGKDVMDTSAIKTIADNLKKVVSSSISDTTSSGESVITNIPSDKVINLISTPLSILKTPFDIAGETIGKVLEVPKTLLDAFIAFPVKIITLFFSFLSNSLLSLLQNINSRMETLLNDEAFYSIEKYQNFKVIK